MEKETLEYLIGQVPKSVTVDDDKERMVFELESGDKVVFYHEQDCCERVSINDIVGDLSDLIGNPLLVAEIVTSDIEDEQERSENAYWEDSYTWTFYKFATIKGYVDVKWYGTSNGYYSESVDVSINGESEYHWKRGQESRQP